MKHLHSLSIRVFIKENEDLDAIKNCLELFLPIDNEKESFLEEERVLIDEQSSMTICKAQLKKKRHCNRCVAILKELLGKKQCELITSQTNRVDEDGIGYVRIQKEPFVTRQEAVLTDAGDCIHFSFQLAAFPKTQEKARTVMKELFKE
ncbi:MAG: RNA-binding domain-containing protein [Candidatus Nanoarchaeia archaeon]